jgi:hypothetical protein
MSIAKAKAEIERLAASGVSIEIVNEGTQPYALVRGVAAPCPPWDKDHYDILITIPLAYDLGSGLDGFYLGLPYKFDGGEHNRVNGQVLNLGGSQWKMVSWHYPDGKGFRENVDTVETHLVHCRGFFSGRGAVNARA